MAELVINNFTRGQLDHDLNGRFDLPFYFNGFEIIRNFLSNYKGNVKYRPGFEFISKIRDNQEAVLMEFRFNTEQAYLLEFTEGKLRFYTYDGNGNFGYVVDTIPANKVPALSSNSQDGFVVSDSRGNSNCYTVFNGDNKAPIGDWKTYWLQLKYPNNKILKEYKIKANSVFTTEYPSAWAMQASADGQAWTTIDSRSGQKFSSGQERSYTVNNDVPYLYYRIKFSAGVTSNGNGEMQKLTLLTVDENPPIIELDTGITLQQAMKLQKAQNADVMYLTMDGINPKKLKRTSAASFTIENALPTGIDFEELGYPAAVTFYSGRLWYAGFSKKPLSVYGSKTTEYDNFEIPSSPKDEDALKLTLADITDPIEWLVGGKQNLCAGNPEGISMINGGGYDVPITATEVNADLANREGASSATPALKDSQIFYISNDKRKVYMLDYDLMTEKYISTDLNWLAKDVTRARMKAIYAKRDDNNMLYTLLENGQLLGLLYNSRENINGWFPTETAGTVKSMATVTRPDGKDDLFICVERSGVHYLEKMSAEAEFSKFYESPHFLTDARKEYYNRIIAEELKQCNYLDCSTRFSALLNIGISVGENIVTAAADVFEAAHFGHYIVYKTDTGKEYGYFRIEEVLSPTQARVSMLSDGFYPESWSSWYISFNEIGGLTDFEGQTVSVVADGGYLGEFAVADGKISFDREMTSCIVGLPYRGILKSFNLGMVVNGRNLQTSKKRIAEFVLRFVHSAGAKIGTDLNDMQDVQYFNLGGFMDLPPLLMDGDVRRNVPDEFDGEKYIFLMQDIPLPMNLTMIQYNMEFS